MFNLSFRRVGGLRFVKLGRLTFSWSIAARFKPFNAPKQPRKRAGRGAGTVLDAVPMADGSWGVA